MAISLSPPFPETDHYSPMLHNVMIAIGSGHRSDLGLESIRNFVTHAKTCWDEATMRPSLAILQSLLLLSTYHQGTGEYVCGWMYMAMANRLALCRRSCPLLILCVLIDSRTA
jgi:hypothetical protein